MQFPEHAEIKKTKCKVFLPSKRNGLQVLVMMPRTTRTVDINGVICPQNIKHCVFWHGIYFRPGIPCHPAPFSHEWI